MKATVKVAYFDGTGLHKPREVVEVSAPNPYVEIIKEKANPAPEVVTEEEAAEPKKSKPAKKKG